MIDRNIVSLNSDIQWSVSWFDASLKFPLSPFQEEYVMRKIWCTWKISRSRGWKSFDGSSFWNAGYL